MKELGLLILVITMYAAGATTGYNYAEYEINSKYNEAKDLCYEDDPMEEE